MSNPRRERARLAANVRHHPDQDHTDYRRDLAKANLAAYIKKVIDAAPSLRDDQRNALAELLRPVRCASTSAEPDSRADTAAGPDSLEDTAGGSD